jgi:3',5'-cyclic AMP phosphodiesterase CpdA
VPDLRATIAHISDLHFGGDVNKELLPQVKRILVDKVKPDFLVVSGDVADSPKLSAMQEASEFINGLATACNIPPERLLVIPGNHDYKFVGNIRDRIRRGENSPFDAWFRGNGNAPAQQMGLLRGIKERVATAFCRPEPIEDEIVVKDSPEFGITLLGFNSNAYGADFATGKVTDSQIASVSGVLKKAGRGEGDSSLKIAVVHHHPIPIPYVPTDLRSRIEESLMVFYNAGAFLREIARCGITLVLHGHKHFAGFTDVAYDNANGDWCKIGVLAAGSATLRNPYDPLGNELNVIYVYDDDTIRIRRWYFSAAVMEADHGRNYDFFQLKDVREQRARNAGRSYGFTVGQLRKQVEITPDGYTKVSTYFEDCHAISADGINSFLVELDSPYKSYLRNFDLIRTANSPALIQIDRDTSKSLLRHVEADLTFGNPVTSKDGPFDFAYTYNLMNGHATSRSEFERKYVGQNVEWEFVSILCDQPADSLDLTVVFPFEGKLSDIMDYSAEVRYVPSPSGQPVTSNVTEPDFKQHNQETSHWRARVKAEKNSLTLRISDPIPGFVYRIRWNYKKESQSIQPGRVDSERAALTRRELINAGRKVADGQLNVPQYDQVDRLASEVIKEIKERYGLSLQEQIDVSLSVFDDLKSELRFVYTSNGKIKDYFKESFTPGEGCAGFSFEKDRVLFYDKGSSNVKYYISPTELNENREVACGLDDYSILITIPLLIGGILSGVLCIGSAKDASDLLSIFDKSNDDKAQEALYLKRLTTLFGAGIASLIK